MTAEQLQDQTEAAGGASAVDRRVGQQSINDSAPVCPHCGYKHEDAWEWNFGPSLEGDSNGRQCYRCDGVFDCERVVDVSYTTRVPNAELNGLAPGEDNK